MSCQLYLYAVLTWININWKLRKIGFISNGLPSIMVGVSSKVHWLAKAGIETVQEVVLKKVQHQVLNRQDICYLNYFLLIPPFFCRIIFMKICWFYLTIYMNIYLNILKYMSLWKLNNKCRITMWVWVIPNQAKFD